MNRVTIATATMSIAALATPVIAAPVRTDVRWAQSQPWIEVALPTTLGTWQLELDGLTVDCADPVMARAGAPDAACLAAVSAGAGLDVVVHAFDAASGAELAAPLRCRAAACQGEFTRGSGRLALMIHGGPEARGRITATARIRAGTTVNAHPIALADNVVLDLARPPATPYDLVSVLVPDGPGVEGPGDPGNAANDYLGVDATEAWLLDAELRVITADLAHSGVGAAATIAHVETSAPRWALVRPWVRPPSALAPRGTRVAVADGRKAPYVGAGRMRVLLNEHYSATGDPDGDGVSSAIERSFATCDGIATVASGRACTTINYLRRYPTRAWMDPRDTDGDGLSDGAEILGSDRAMGTPPNTDGSCAPAAPRPIADADQTFPLWGFDPRHRDLLIEIDRVIPDQDTCPTATSGCPADGTTQPYPQELVDWHARYAELPSERVNNPDREPGLELHFDARLTAGPTMAHGTRAGFTLTDRSGRVRPGLVIYRPDPTDGGSQCACNGVAMCADPRHGGYGRYARYASGYGGGNASCNGSIDYGGTFQAASHEMGHHLGLQHGGPTNCLGNPFGIDAAIEPEIVLPNKLIFESPMSYLHAYDPSVSFSTGSRRHFTLPRTDAAGGPLAYPEDEVFLGDTVDRVGAAVQFPASGPPARRCPPETSCTDLDFDFDGAFDGRVTLPVDRSYYFGRDFMTSVGGYWCQTEQEPIGGGGCCTRPTNPGAAHQCIGGGTPTEPTLTRTMLMAGSPATVIAGGRWYEFFVDDAITDDDVSPGQIPPRRCGRTAQRDTGCTPLDPTAPMEGKLRWARITGWSIERERASQSACRGHGSECGTGIARGDVHTTGVAAEARLWGNTLLAAATVGTGTDEHVILAWSSRGTDRASGFHCSGAECSTGWSPLRLRIGPASDIESTGFTTSTTLAFPTGEDPRVSGVGMTRWNLNTGAADQTLVIVRQAITRRLWWARCDRTGCGVAAPLGGTAAAIVSAGPVAVTAENVNGARAPRLAVAYTDTRNQIQLATATADPDATTLTPSIRAVVDRNGVGVSATSEAALSIAFTEPSENRMLLYYEAGTPTTFLATGRAHTLDGSGAIAVGYIGTNPWDLTRPPHRLAADGTAAVTQGPGLVPALIYDGRTGVTDDSRLVVMEKRVRAFMSVVGQGSLFNQSVTTADGRPDVAFHDYDEVTAMAWMVCPTVANSGLGQAGPDLDAGGPPLQCPSAADWSVAGPRIPRINHCYAAGGRCFRWVDPRDRVTNPADRVSWPVLVADLVRSAERRHAITTLVAKPVTPVAFQRPALPVCAADAPAAALVTPPRDLKELLRRVPAAYLPRDLGQRPTFDHAPIAPGP